MELDYDGSDQEFEEIEVVDNLNLVDVMQILEQKKTIAFTLIDREFV